MTLQSRHLAQGPGEVMVSLALITSQPHTPLGDGAGPEAGSGRTFHSFCLSLVYIAVVRRVDVQAPGICTVNWMKDGWLAWMAGWLDRLGWTTAASNLIGLVVWLSGCLAGTWEFGIQPGSSSLSQMRDSLSVD